jgi:integrase
MANITVRGIEALRPTDKEYKVTVDRGLYLRVARDGVKTWLVRYVVNTKQVQARLPRPYGADGEAGYMSLAQALAENARIQSLAREGIDFQVQRAAAEKARNEAAAAAAAAEIPFKQLFETWMADGVSRKDGNAEIRRTFTRDILPAVGAKPVREVTDSDILHVLRAVGRKRGAARTAERLLSELRQLFRWAIKRQPWRALLNHHGNPADLVELKQVVPQGWQPGIRDRVLSPKEIRELQDRFAEMDASYEASPDKRVADRPLQMETRLALWICLGTACRIGELVQSQWRNVDLKKGVWFVPKETTKTNVDWYVYLSDFSLHQFEQLHELTGDTEWCFPAQQRDGPLDKKTIGKQVGDRQMRFKKRKALKGRRHDDTLVLGGGENGEWTPHDLRRTASTMMQSLRISPDVIDRCQNHALPGSKVRRHYLHYDYAEEKREAWRLLGDRLDAILTGSNVVPLLKAA